MESSDPDGVPKTSSGPYFNVSRFSRLPRYLVYGVRGSTPLKELVRRAMNKTQVCVISSARL